MVVSAAQIERAPAGGPERAFLEWFRAVQTRDARTAVRFYSSAVGIVPSEFARLRRRADYALDPLARPRIIGVERTGSRAVVSARFPQGQVTPNGRREIYEDESEVAAFTMVREGGRWKFPDNRFLETVARTETRRAEPAAKPAGRVVTRAQLRRFREGSPARIFLEWFRALQRGDAAAAAQLYLPSLGITTAGIRRQRRAASYAIDGFASPSDIRTRVDGDRAVVSAAFQIARYRPDGSIALEPRGDVPFKLERAGGEWRLADNGLLEVLSRTPSG